LVEEIKVVAACGLTDDSLVSAAGPTFQSNKTVFLDGTATTPTIPRIGDYIFMVPFGDNYQGRAVAKYCADKLGWKKVVVIWDNASAYSTDLSNFFMESFKEFTGDENAVAHQEIYQTGDVNFTAQLTRLRLKMSKEKIDGIVITPPFPQDGPIIAKQAAKLGIKLPVVLTDGADDQTVIEVGGEHIEGALISTHFAAEYPLTENAKKFVEAYQAEYNSEPGAFECLGFDAIQIMIESMETIGKDKWDAMTLEDRRSALRDTIQNHKFVTTTMPISYPDPESVKYPRIPDKPVVFKVVQDGKRVFKDIINPEDLK
jgi:branched-chain amino acid transport system substrate-binding protein